MLDGVILAALKPILTQTIIFWASITATRRLSGGHAVQILGHRAAPIQLLVRPRFFRCQDAGIVATLSAGFKPAILIFASSAGSSFRGLVS